ncbi:MAG: hypothetical protein AAGJ08_20250 [Cyanobacteria bacterium P01_H01_bin.35]
MGFTFSAKIHPLGQQRSIIPYSHSEYDWEECFFPGKGIAKKVFHPYLK